MEAKSPYWMVPTYFEMRLGSIAFLNRRAISASRMPRSSSASVRNMRSPTEGFFWRNWLMMDVSQGAPRLSEEVKVISPATL